MSFQTTRKRLEAKQDELERAKKQLAEYEKKALSDIAKLAKSAGLLEADISEAELKAELEDIAKRFQKQNI